MTHTIKVSLTQKNYPTYIGEKLLQDKLWLQKVITTPQILIVSNATVAQHYLAAVQQAFADRQCDVVLLPDGEAYKNLETLNKIFDVLLAKKHRRQTTLIALGGGVVGDIAGFAAATYQRGVAYVQMPTTLLAQVDSATGGKTAVNHPLGKNMIGAFHQPQAVIIDPTVLKTLPKREFCAGLAEMIKAALIADADFFNWLEQHIEALMQQDIVALTEAIVRAVQIKVNFVSQDEFETTGARALLNFGHTFGHAIEQASGYGVWLHGEAVAMGIVSAAQLSVQKGWLTKQDVERIEKILTAAQLPIRLQGRLDCDKILAAMAVDKKFADTKPRLILLSAIGKATIVTDLSWDQVRQVI